MREITISQAAEMCGGLLYGMTVDSELTSVCIDSRKACGGAMFAALKGEKADGHDYMAKAFELGAACCLAERIPENVNGAVIVVPDVAAALKVFAEKYRARFSIPVIGIAGSVGKTTAKEMVAAVLSVKYNVLKTEKNLNNELGVPLTLFRINPEHEAAVVEMGISDFGEMTRLAKMVRPTMAVYTLIGHAHLEALGDRNGVLKAKTEMLDFMPDSGTVFLNGDDDLLSEYNCRQKRVMFGTKTNSSVRAVNIGTEPGCVQCCDIVCGERKIHARIQTFGIHMIYAALEGAAVGIELGLTDAEIAAGIENFETVGRRASVFTSDFLTLIDDCYNANPDSVKCGIDSLCKSEGRKVCILGDMLEMGLEKEKLHAEVGRYASEKGVDLLITAGDLSAFTAAAAFGKTKAYHFKNNLKLIDALPGLLVKGDTVLVKASHSMKFEEISEYIKLMK